MRDLKNDSHVSFFEIIQSEIHHHPELSAAQIADRVGKALSTFYNELNPDVKEAKLGVGTYRIYLRETHCLASLDLIESENGRVAIDLRKIGNGSKDVQVCAAAMLKGAGELLEMFTSLNGKGNAQERRRERDQFNKKADQAIAAVELFRRAVVKGKS